MCLLKALVFLLLAIPLFGENTIGPRGLIGVLNNPKKVDRLVITKSGIYENYLVDAGWQGGNRVKVSCDDVVIRNCEIRNATDNGIGVFGKRVLIEKCRIHHMLAGSYADQSDLMG
jgi:hypothetical protein